VVVATSPTASPTAEVSYNQADNNLPLFQYFDDAQCNEGNYPPFHMKWGCNKVEDLGASWFIKKCEGGEFLFDLHWRWIPDYHCQSSTFQDSMSMETKKCYRYPNSNLYLKICCGSCRLNDTEVVIVVCSSIIGVLLIVAIINCCNCCNCCKWKKCCFKKKNEVGRKDKPNVKVSNVKVRVETEAQEVEGKKSGRATK